VDHLTRSLTNGLVDAALERAADIRGHERRLRELCAHPDCRIIPVWQDKNLVAGDEDMCAVWLTTRELPPGDGDTLVFLGMIEGGPCFALDLPEMDPRLPRLEPHGRFVELRTIGPVMADRDASVLSYARGMCHWHRRHFYCGACGHRTIPIQGGHVRRCTNEHCGIHHFPRTDPAIIVLVNDQDRCLLGRKAEWPKGRFSTIAGFVEPGEAVEQAVVREVYEETAIRVGEVSYHSSQPWPFPGSVMLGFHARAAGDPAIELLDGELEDARWFSRLEVEQALNRTGPLRLPPGISIARRLIEDWYHHGHLQSR
jgi:NAD+ diphosphatase